MPTPATLIGTTFGSLLDFFYPACCIGCTQELMLHETLLCSDCIGQLPYIDNGDTLTNPVFMAIAGRVPVRYAGAVFDFKKGGIIQHLLHELKYNGRPDIGRFLGRIAGEHMRRCAYFMPPDCIVPVPLHKHKEKKRGYNQSLCIAEGFLESFPEMRIERTLLERSEGSESQTRKNRISRWENVKSVFHLSENALEDKRFSGKHFLVIDDVFTTGATVESCVRQILRLPASEVSVLTMAAPV